MFCVECGKEEAKLIGGSCASCFTKTTRLLDAPQVLDVELCAHCDARHVGNSWHDPDEGVPLDWIREEAARGAARVHELVRHPVLTLSERKQDEKHSVFTIRMEGDVDEVPVQGQLELIVRMRRSVCDRCSKMFGGYYAAIIQFRATDRDVREDEVQRGHKVVGDELDRLRANGNRDAFLTKSGAVPGGFDYYIGDIEGARIISKELARRLGATVVETAKLAGRKLGEDLFRVTFLVRIALYSESDFAAYRDGVVQVVSLNKGRAVILDLHTHKKDRAQEEELKRLGGPEALQAAILVSQDAANLQVLDPVSLKTVDLPRPEGYQVEEGAGQVWVLRHEERLWLPASMPNSWRARLK
jgi:nonsense-mediated mRNA decay protein 3